MSSRIVKAAKDLGATLVSASTLHRRLHQRLHRRDLTILMYHGVLREPLPISDPCFISAAAFRQQVEYLRRHFSVVSLANALELLQHDAVEKPTVVLTFDDGYQNNCDIAFPVLKEFGVPAIIFLATGLVNTSDSVWFCSVVRALSTTRKQSLQWEGEQMELSNPVQRSAASLKLQASIKQHPPAEVGPLVERLCEQLAVDALAKFEPGSPFRMLTSNSITRMVESGLVEFGGHTVTHTILSLLSPDEQRREILGSLEAVQSLTGQPCRYFAYPNGRPQDYNASTIEFLREGGVTAAVSTITGPNDSRTSRMDLKRYGVGPHLGMPRFELLAHHFMNHVS
jgi:peptidoglycan/xylan/chitin deacetylase (PgdA/CDA1 family)